ncbi:hypothetical protein CR194_03195 [Salipaludibacillus keqinensis]|uniref:Chromosome-anchoring protein RacA n=1 Tax=Salipaludibacillus keqinensis TaxID=2045207 RepID=A0A323TPK4_9BACI|nr:helix-turn-helix domain-containing protein [Salipaludibacillus keqinensis]PYZ94553.1 hypothetical protein CR194_03195 [Salipaludibacillus keqinensis]
MSISKWKTKDIADELRVNPSTVQRWIKYFQLPYEVNKHGHFELTEETYQKLHHIHSETKEGKKMRHISLSEATSSINIRPKEKMVPAQRLDERIEKLIIQVEQLDRNLHTKADEVVEYQVLNHRKEINELNGLISQLTQRLKVLEDELSKKEKASKDKSGEIPLRKRRLAGIFSL